MDYDGRAYNYRELYGCAGKPDVGIRWTAQKIADKILELEVQVDPSLIAGIKVQANDLVMDNTVIAKIDAMKEAINR